MYRKSFVHWKVLGATVLTVVMLVSIHGLAESAQASPAWAGYYVASTLA